jgi:hypothetical protein
MNRRLSTYNPQPMYQSGKAVDVGERLRVWDSFMSMRLYEMNVARMHMNLESLTDRMTLSTGKEKRRKGAQGLLYGLPVNLGVLHEQIIPQD